MSSNINPSAKSIDISTQDGLELLRAKAKHYGHYAENLKVLELIQEVEKLRIEIGLIEAMRHLNV